MFNSERFQFDILSVHSLNVFPSTRYSARKTYNALIFRKNGTADLIHDRNRYSLTKNSVTFIPKGYDYTITTNSEEDLIIIHFDAEIKNGKDFFTVNLSRPEKLLSLFEKILETWKQKPVGFVYKLDSIFSSILESLERQSIEKQLSLLELTIQRAVDQMHVQLGDPELTIDKIALHTGYTPSYFRRVFKKYVGMSPVEYLIKIRIEYATSLLESGYYTVDKTAFLCGFISTKYFSTFYKQRTGVSPSKVIPSKGK